MWLYLVIVIAGFLLASLVWVLQPYFVWRRNQAKNEGQRGKISVLSTSGKAVGLARHLEQKKEAIQLSVVVPSYNEEKRLPIMLDETIAYLTKNKIKYEIIVVNDGSKDRTSEVAIQKAIKEGANLYVVEYMKNRGKGGAVRAGMACAIGEQILMVDADGATKFSELKKMQEKLEQIKSRTQNQLIMVAGSRSHLDEDDMTGSKGIDGQVKVQRKFHRKLVSSVFGFIKTVVCGVKTKDTQCGFKLFTKDCAKVLFQALHIERWAFDIQLFVLSNVLKIETGQVPVEWHDVDGSKLNVVEASVNMFRDLVMIKLMYTLRLWKQSDRVIVE